MTAVKPQGSSLRKGAAKIRSRDVTRIQDHDEDKFKVESKIRERKNRILDALETRYYRSGQRPSSAARIEETSVPEELPQDARINTTTKVRPTGSVIMKNIDVNGTTMFNPDVTEYTLTTNDEGTKLSWSGTENDVLLMLRE